MSIRKSNRYRVAMSPSSYLYVFTVLIGALNKRLEQGQDVCVIKHSESGFGPACHSLGPSPARWVV